LKQENLNPEIEEKLLNLQRYQEKQMKNEQFPSGQSQFFEQDMMAHHSFNNSFSQSQYNEDDDSDDTNIQSSGHQSRKRRSEMDDDEWRMDSPRKRSTTKSYSSSTNPHYQSENIGENQATDVQSNVVFRSSNYVNYSKSDALPPKIHKKSTYEKKKIIAQKPNKLQVIY
jgi:nucleosome-remodeling factor subunit BPTF